ncbi:MAG: hypothetical protein JSR90_09985 [Proteobacteria bacterium]|nr:hypothetical protein [Pseudomonadota bacterium]
MIHPFTLGHVGGALVAGAVAGTFFDGVAVVTFAAILAANAVIGTFICWRWPGLDASAWKLWLAASLANPLVLAGLVWSGIQYDCLLGDKTGWGCMFSEVGPFAAGMGLLPPVLGVVMRRLLRRA